MWTTRRLSLLTLPAALLLTLSACQPPAQSGGASQSGASQSGVAAPTPAAQPEPTAPAGSAQPDTETVPAPAVLTAEVVARFPHDPAAFTQGLQYLGSGMLLESTGQVGESGVRLVKLDTGEVTRQVPTPAAQAFGEGVTRLGGGTYHITWQTGEAYRFDDDLKLQQTYRYEGEGWGITHDGQQLIMSDGSARLLFRDPQTFAVTREVTVRDDRGEVRNLNELEWVDGAVWANVWQSDELIRIDPQTGAVTGRLDVSDLAAEAAAKAAASGQRVTPDDVTNGVAYDAGTGHFYLTGKRWPLLFEVKVSGEGQGQGPAAGQTQGQ